MKDLIEKIKAATAGAEAIDAEIVATLNSATVRPYPPSDDFGPKDRWQFWSLDGKHFLGNEHKFKVQPYTRSVDAALTLVPEGWRSQLFQQRDGTWGARIISPTSDVIAPFENEHPAERVPSPALAICAAALSARSI